MSENNERVKIKLERHQWPDEMKPKRKNTGVILLTVFAILVSFGIGWTFSRAAYGNNTTVVQNSEIARFERIYNKVLNNWYFANDMDNPKSQLIENAIKGMLDLNGDPHTSYMTLKESQDFSSSIDMSFVGIGVMYYAGDGVNVITRVYKDSPAERAGIKAGDVLYAIDGNLVSQINADGKDIKEFILGTEGTNVKVSIQRQGEQKDFEITRGQINALTWGEMLNSDTGYLEISSFGQNLKSSTEVYLDFFKQSGAKKLIIDMRDNGGGYLAAINEVSQLLFDAGDTIYKETFTDGSETVYKVTKSERSNYPFEEIVVLVNQNTASAAEVLTLAMQENLGVKVIGVTTYGKGTVQTQWQDTVDKSYLKYTMAKWFSPSGVSIHQTGIKPDIDVKLADVFYKEYVVLNDGESFDYDTVSNAAAYIQSGLKFLGYHSGRTDGYYDTATRDALLAYLSATKQTASTVITQETIRSVYTSVLSEWSQNRKQHDTQLQKAIEVLTHGS